MRFAKFPVSTLAMIMCGLLTCLAATHASAALLTSDYATATVDAPSGMTSWTMDGVEQLGLVRYFYRIGNAQPCALDTLPFTTSSDGNTDNITFHFTHTQFNAEITYTIAGSDPGTGSFTESIAVNNRTGATLDFHLFRYSDYNLNNTPTNDTLTLASNIFTQADPGGAQITVARPAYTSWQIAGQGELIPNSPGASKTLLQMMTWNQSPGFALNNSGSVTNGDAVFALQWDASLAAGGKLHSSLTSSVAGDFTVIPEPVGLPVLSLVGLALLFRRRIPATCPSGQG